MTIELARRGTYLTVVVVSALVIASPAAALDLMGLVERAMADTTTEDHADFVPCRIGADGTAGLLGRRLIGTLRRQCRPTEAERADIEFMYDMLSPEKLGGEDETFNQHDVPVVAAALLDDLVVADAITRGIREEVERSIAAAPWGLRWLYAWQGRRRVTPGNATYDAWWPTYWARGRKNAVGRIIDQVSGALAREGITPPPTSSVSRLGRQVTKAELERFDGAASTLRSYGDRMARLLGRRCRLPHGPSREDLRAILQGRTPPNGVDEPYCP